MAQRRSAPTSEFLIAGALQGLTEGIVKGMQVRGQNEREQAMFDLNKEKLELEKRKLQSEGIKDKQDIEQKLMAMRNGLPMTKQTQEMVLQYQKAIGSSDNGPGDIALIFSYMKLLDPSSVVRGEEFNQAMKTAGAEGWVKSAWKQIENGQRLTPEQRAQFKSESTRLYTGHVASQDQTDQQFKDLAVSYGVDPENVIIKFDAPSSQQKESLATPSVWTKSVPSKFKVQEAPKQNTPKQKDTGKSGVKGAAESARSGIMKTTEEALEGSPWQFGFSPIETTKELLNQYEKNDSLTKELEMQKARKKPRTTEQERDLSIIEGYKKSGKLPY